MRQLRTPGRKRSTLKFASQSSLRGGGRLMLSLESRAKAGWTRNRGWGSNDFSTTDGRLRRSMGRSVSSWFALQGSMFEACRKGRSGNQSRLVRWAFPAVWHRASLEWLVGGISSWRVCPDPVETDIVPAGRRRSQYQRSSIVCATCGRVSGSYFEYVPDSGN
jgi:hypothetical protein